MANIQEKFRKLICELVQFDLVDLDFDFYLIFSHNRQVIERSLNEDLSKAIKKELQPGEQAEARQKVLETRGVNAIDPDGTQKRITYGAKNQEETINAGRGCSSPSERVVGGGYSMKGSRYPTDRWLGSDESIDICGNIN